MSITIRDEHWTFHLEHPIPNNWKHARIPNHTTSNTVQHNKTTQIIARNNDFQMTSSGIHVLVLHCCFLAVSFLPALRAWPHHSSTLNASTPSICDCYFSPVIPLKMCAHPSFLSPILTFGLTTQSGCVRSTLLIKERSVALQCTDVLPRFSTVLLILSDRHFYYYKPRTVLLKFFAYPVTSFYTYRV